jgi:hypothetical protein
MLVVKPPSMRVDPSETTPHEEHLLERLTILENTLARLAERLEQGLKLLLRVSETGYTNDVFVNRLIEILNICGVVDNERLESMWRAECAKLNETPTETSSSTKQPKKARKAKGKASTRG